MTHDLDRFENLRDNCEFAFYLRDAGLDEGSLFRWTLVRNYWSLLRLLQSDFKDLFIFDNLQPSWQDMVLDKNYDFCFHTKMFSENHDGKWLWQQDTQELHNIYQHEREKVSYLVSKLKKSLENEKRIFVIKNNANDLDDFSIQLASELKRHGNAKLLHIKSTEGKQSDNRNQIEKVASNLYVSYIDKFAPYNKADAYSKEGWDTVVKLALREM